VALHLLAVVVLEAAILLQAAKAYLPGDIDAVRSLSIPISIGVWCVSAGTACVGFGREMPNLWCSHETKLMGYTSQVSEYPGFRVWLV
jgi:hypothetical protein